jgi:hypothetical protein
MESARTKKSKPKTRQKGSNSYLSREMSDRNAGTATGRDSTACHVEVEHFRNVPLESEHATQAAPIPLEVTSRWIFQGLKMRS